LRSGPATAIRIDDRVVLVDAGNGTQGRLQQAGIQLEQLDALLITHHHLDHDQELIPLVITSLVRGLTPEIVGAPGTVRMIGFMKEFYREDIAYRAGRSPGADVNPDSLRVRDVDGGETLSIAGATVRTAQVQHTIHTVAYRFDVGSESIVVSGDLTYSASLVDLARGADVLVVDSGNLPGPDGLTGRAGGRGGGRGAAPPGGRGAPGGRGMRGGRAAGSFQPQAARAHPSLAEIASMATQAGVPCIVLTHINRTEVDEAATLELFRPLYSGKVIVASDMLETTSGCATSGAA
jgi:ribonuclease BN (tRNA processing enzyme)